MMICPCCGQEREISGPECASCGARQVGEPLAPPDVVMPKMGPAFAAFGIAAVVVVTFLAAWIFSNDMKVGRAFLIYAFGDGTKLTQSLLQGDPRLPFYRIFNYDAYRLATILSWGAVPVTAFGIWLARRAGRLAADNPAGFGGLRISRFSMIASTALCVVFSIALISSIPNTITRGRLKREAATRAMMYELHQRALQKYYNEYGSYPQELTDLGRVNAEASPRSDYWERNFSYLPVGVIASKGSAISFSNYKLVSAGPDQKFDTEDDIIMIDGVIVDRDPESDPQNTSLIPEKGRR